MTGKSLGSLELAGHVVVAVSQVDVLYLQRPRTYPLFKFPLVVLNPCSVKLLTGSLSHENPGNQFGHVAPIFTIILLTITAVFQIICLNRGLKVYDSTLVAPVFYGVYTAAGYVTLFAVHPVLTRYM